MLVLRTFEASNCAGPMVFGGCCPAGMVPDGAEMMDLVSLPPPLNNMITAPYAAGVFGFRTKCMFSSKIRSLGGVGGRSRRRGKGRGG